jgi:hypothetical protein
MKKLLLILMCVAASVYSRHAQDTMVIVKPDLSKAVIGFKITSEEEQEFCEYITKELSNAFGVRIVSVKRSGLENIAGAGKPVLYYLITDAHAIYRSPGVHYYEISSVLYKLQPGDTVTGPVVYATPNSFGVITWGNNRPFESALRVNINELTNKIRGKKGSVHAGSIRLDSLVREERFIDCDKKAYFVQPEFSEATFDNIPSDNEVHDFTRLISSHLGRVLHADFRIIQENEADSISACAAIISRVVFNVPAQKVSFSLEHKTSNGVKKIDRVYENLDVNSWNENLIFMQGLLALYKLMDADIKK